MKLKDLNDLNLGVLHVATNRRHGVGEEYVAGTRSGEKKSAFASRYPTGRQQLRYPARASIIP